MGVYRPKRRDKSGDLRETPYWHYDFTIKGDRFHGSTGQKSRRAAEAFEERQRKAVADGTYFKKRDDPASLSFNDAAGVYWMDVGQHRRSKEEIERDLEVLIDLIGPTTRIGDIRTPVVRAVMERRRQGLASRTKPNPSPATMNRLLECLRAVLNHVAEEHEAALPRIAWKRLMEREAPPPERTFSTDELSAWAAHLDEIERFFLIVSMTYGPRLGELFVPPEAIDLSNPSRPVMRLGRYYGRKARTVRKDGTLLDVALLPDDAALLGYLADRARAAGLKHIWAREDAKGRIKPINYYGMRRRLLSAAQKAGIRPGRVIHSLRHHAASAIVASSGDITLARKALGHSSVTTTQRYAHAGDRRLLDTLAEVSRRRPEQPAGLVKKSEHLQSDTMVPPPGLEPGTPTHERNGNCE